MVSVLRLCEWIRIEWILINLLNWAFRLLSGFSCWFSRHFSNRWISLTFGYLERSDWAVRLERSFDFNRCFGLSKWRSMWNATPYQCFRIWKVLKASINTFGVHFKTFFFTIFSEDTLYLRFSELSTWTVPQSFFRFVAFYSGFQSSISFSQAFLGLIFQTRLVFWFLSRLVSRCSLPYLFFGFRIENDWEMRITLNACVLS